MPPKGSKKRAPAAETPAEEGGGVLFREGRALKVAVTGILAEPRPMKRDQFKAAVEAAGGVYSAALSGKTDVLVCGEPKTGKKDEDKDSQKIRDAEAKRVTVVSYLMFVRALDGVEELPELTLSAAA